MERWRASWVAANVHMRSLDPRLSPCVPAFHCDQGLELTATGPGTTQMRNPDDLPADLFCAVSANYSSLFSLPTVGRARHEAGCAGCWGLLLTTLVVNVVSHLGLAALGRSASSWCFDPCSPVFAAPCGHGLGDPCKPDG